MRSIGVDCEICEPATLGLKYTQSGEFRHAYSGALRQFLREKSSEFEAVEFDHESLPCPRLEFFQECLMVARSVLLVHHLQRIRLPRRVTLRSALGEYVRGPGRARFEARRVAEATRTIEQADLVNVSSDHDKAELVRRGITEPNKIVVLPFGLSNARRVQFDRTTTVAAPAGKIVVFVGTFDWRKGAADFPEIVRQVCDAVPAARFRLLGTRGLMRTAREVYALFPRRLRAKIEVVPEFEPDELPGRLSDCAAGVFPSYYEGFGFGVLEMLAAAIPVVAYGVPGPPMMLGPQWLVPAGDVTGMAQKVIAILKDPAALAVARIEARQASEPFDWTTIARQTLQVYSERLRAKREHSQSASEARA